MSIIWTRRLNLNDFFRYVNGTWLDNTEIPSDRTRWGSFDELRQKTDADALAILKEAATNQNTNQIQIKARQSICTKRYLILGRNKLGITPLKPYLKKIDAVKTQKTYNLINRNGTLRRIGFFGANIGPDAKK
jgi:endothelin-converting enzyme/putative endopeptidase